MSTDTSAFRGSSFSRKHVIRPLLLLSFLTFLFILLVSLGPCEETGAEDVAFYQAGGFGGAYKNTHYDGEHLYVTHYQGMSIFDISDPDNLEEIGFCLTDGFAYGLWVDGDHAYVGNGYESMVVIDISDRTDPVIVGEIANEWFATGIFVKDSYAYVADGYFQTQDQGGLLIYDISDPTTPTQTGKLSTPQGGPNEVVVIDEYAYIANGQDGLLIADISNPAAPYRVGSYGTSYACDLAVRDNYAYIADRTGGLVIIDHSFKQFPAQVGAYDTDGEAWGIELIGDLAYIADFDFGLQIIDVSNPNFPVKVGELDTDDESMKVTIVDDRAYIADNRNGLVVADVSVAATPQQSGHFETAGMVMDVELADGYVYVGNENQIFILEASDVTHPEAVGFYEATGNGEGDGIRMDVVGDHCYIANGEAGLVILDISDKSNPQQIGQSDTDHIATDVHVVGNYAYVVDKENGLVIIDVSNPMLPQQVGHYDTNDEAVRIVVRDDLAYIGDRFEDLQIIDVSIPSNPTFVGNWTSEDGHVNGVALSGDYAYLSTGAAGLRIIDISDPSSPVEVGDYPTEGWAMLGVNVIGNYALLGDNLNGIVIVNVTDPSDPQLEFHYDTPDASSTIEVLGNYAFVADRYNGLVIGEVTGIIGGTPRAIIESIAPSPAYPDEEIAFEGAGSGGSGSYDRFEWRSNLDGELYAGPEDSFTHTGFSTGNHTIYLKVRDDEGTWSYEERSSIMIGHQPEVEIESPDDGSQVDGEVEITGLATDGDGDETIESVEVSIDGENWIEVNGTSDWDHTWDTSEVENGEHTLTFRCQDDIGYSEEVTLTLDVLNEVGNRAPEVTITSPEDGEELSDTITIEGTATDEDGDETIESVELSLDSDEWMEVSGTDTWTYDLDTTELEDGEHIIAVRAYDGEEYSEVVTITMNIANGEGNEEKNAIPTITVLSPFANSTVSGLVSISVRAEDEDGDGDIQRVEFSINGSAWQGLNGAGVWSYTWDSETISDGVYVLSFRAFDGTEYSKVSEMTVTIANGGDSDDDDDGIDTNILLGAGGLVVVIILGVAFLVVRKKDEEGEPCPDCGEGLDYIEEYESWYCSTCEEYKE